jgi:hypothetical protein
MSSTGASTLAAAAAAALLAASPVLAARAAATFTEAEARRLTREVSLSVEAIRGLKFKKPVAVKVVDDRAARKHFKARIDQFWPADEVRLEQAAYIQLGLLPVGTDVVGNLLDLLEEQAGGYYDPKTETFFILEDMPRAAAPILMAHELTHALDDQHVDLDTILGAAASDDDRGTALGAVVEGSGTLVMTAYMLREMEAGRIKRNALTQLQEGEAGKAEKLRNAPPFLERMLMGPYLLGPTFLLRGDTSRLSSGVVSSRDITKALTSPPESTEQILHPEKYWSANDRDLPQKVGLPDLHETVGAGWKLRLTAGLGELAAAVLVGSGAVDPRSSSAYSPASWTNAAATGWDGDHLQLYEGARGTVTVLASVWDTEKDAAEFEAALVPAPPKTVLRKADAVVIVVAAEGVDAEAVAKAALEGMTRATSASAAGAARSR